MSSRPNGSAPPGAVSKAMSGRLLNMKFMQRAAASSSRNARTTSSSTPSGATSTTPQAAAPVAVAARGVPGGDPDAETPWALSYVPTPAMKQSSAKGLRIISGFSAEELASADDEASGATGADEEEEGEEGEEEDTGRMVFGTFRAEAEAAAKAAAKANTGYKSSSDDSNSSDSGSGSEEDEEESQRRKQLKREKKEKEAMRKQQKRGLERGGLSGLSAGAKIGFQGECYNCGEKGHMGRDCTRGKKRRKVDGGR